MDTMESCITTVIVRSACARSARLKDFAGRKHKPPFSQFSQVSVAAVAALDDA
jgi:hypothetical protein